MKVLTYLIAITLLITACSKSTSQPTPDDPNSVILDGTKYPILKYGNQIWTVVNYNGSSGANYNDNPVNDPQYGKLYTYKEATAIKLPKGWRLPTVADFSALVNSYRLNPYALLSKTGWIEKLGTNESGFNVYPAGYHSQYFANATYGHLGEESAFITTTLDNDSIHTICFNFVSYHGTAGAATMNVLNTDNDRASIRFVKDE